MNTIINEIWNNPDSPYSFEIGKIKYKYFGGQILTGIYEDIKVSKTVGTMFTTPISKDQLEFWFRNSIISINKSILRERIKRIFGINKINNYVDHIDIPDLSLKIQIIDGSKVFAYNTINNQTLGEFLLFGNDLKKMINSILIKNILSL